MRTRANITGGGQGVMDVPARIVQEFLAALEKEGMPLELISRLRQTLLIDKALGDKALREALFPETFEL